MRPIFLVCTAVLAAAVFSPLARADRIELPPGPNRDLVYAKCRTCHDLQYVKESAGITADNWEALIEDMGQYGLRIPKADKERIVKYLVTYLGPNPPKSPPAAESPSPAVDGAAMYARQCSACHQAHGGGLPDTFPPLAGNHDLYRDRMFPVYVVLNGLTGPITVKGMKFNGTMPPFDHLSDAEIAAVIGYVRAAWNNAELRPAGFVDVDEGAVKKARAEPMKNTDVYARRTKLVALASAKGVAAPVSAANKSVIAHGRYLVRTSGCNDCHTAGYAESGGKVPEADWLTGNPVGFSGPWGTSYPANLRLSAQSMPEAAWIARARSQLLPPMPWFALRDMKDADVRAIYQYIRSLGAKGKPAPRRVGPGGKVTTPYIEFVPKNLPKSAARR